MANQIEKYTDDEFEDYLNEIYGEVTIAGIKIDAGRILREMDPIAFDCAKNERDEFVWECEDCGEVYDTEEEAEECCS